MKFNEEKKERLMAKLNFDKINVNDKKLKRIVQW